MLRWRLIRGQQGAALTLCAVMLVLISGVMALVIDLGHLYVVKSELQRAADAGAIAGALKLFDVPPGARYPVSTTPDCNRARAASQSIVGANQADGGPLQVLASDVTFGRWDMGSRTFVATGCANPKEVTAVGVLVRKDQTANGQVALFFLGLLPGGWNRVSLTAQALGLTGFAGYAPRGTGFPLAIDVNKVPPDHGREPVRIHLNPTPGDAGCWHTFDDRSPGASDLRDLVDGSTPSPPLKVGDNIKVKEGVGDSVLQELKRQLDNRGGEWEVLCPVVPAGSHTGWAPVLGFASFRITAVNTQGGDKYLEGYAVPDYVGPGTTPGGPNYGVWSGVPKLVQ